MEELVAHIERSPKLNAATKWKQPNALGLVNTCNYHIRKCILLKR